MAWSEAARVDTHAATDCQFGGSDGSTGIRFGDLGGWLCDWLRLGSEHDVLFGRVHRGSVAGCGI